MMHYLLLLVFLATLPVHAQVLPPYTQPVILTISPSFPEAHSSLTVSIDSSAFDLTQSTIEWYVDDRKRPEFSGVRTITITTPDVGETLTVGAIIDTNSQLYGGVRTIRPAEVDLLWDTNTYVPPTYRGRRLPSPSAQIQLEAFPRIIDGEGKAVPREQLIYVWKRNDALISSVSGVGRFTVLFPAPRLFSTDTITVEVSTRKEGKVAEKTIRIPSVDPFIRLYYDHPLHGTLFHRELSTNPLIQDTEAAVVAIPFFAQVSSPATRELIYEWRVNGNAITTSDEAPHRLTLNAGNQGGEGRIQLSLSSERDYFLDANGRWNVLLSLDRSRFSNPDPFR